MSTPWNGKALSLVRKNEVFLTVRAAKEGDNLTQVFETSQLADLFATAQGAQMPVLAENFVMYGKEKRDDGLAKAIQAADQRAYKDKDGNERMANHAYSATQVAKFEPVTFAVTMKFVKGKNGKSFPMPLFLAYALPLERRASAPNAPADAPFQRVTAKPAVTEAPIERKKAK